MIVPRPLSTASLRHHGRRAAVPRYDRAALRPGVVHMSVGSFHRSHQAVVFDDLAQRGHRDWGIVGVGLRRRAMKDALDAQDGLYTVVERRPEGDTARIIGVLRRYLFAPEQPAETLAALADPRTRLVTLTVTGVAYEPDPPGDVDPCSVWWYLVEALRRRRRAGQAPFTVLSCDNLADNGALTRAAVVACARRRDRDLAAWIEERGAFPSAMVDRITPRTTDADRRRLAREHGILDRWPVITEPWSQWIVEDAFADVRPPFEEVGVQVVGDVRPYALTKTRLLNATHCALGHLGSVAGLNRTDEAMADPVLGAYAERLMRDEIAPLLPSVPGLDLDSYCDALVGRLTNPKIGDQLERLCRWGSSKLPAHVLPSLASARADGRPHELLTLAVAGWIRQLQGFDERGRPLIVEDPLAATVVPLATAGGTDPRPLLFERSLFGELGRDPGFAAEVEHVLEAFARDGVREAIRERLTSGDPLVA